MKCSTIYAHPINIEYTEFDVIHLRIVCAFIGLGDKIRLSVSQEECHSLGYSREMVPKCYGTP